jgi:membrane protein implicated in regulation of membrane protease activity
MNARLPPGRSVRPFDWLVRIVAAVLTVAVLVASFFIGAVIALIAVGLAAVVWAVFAFRWWQLKRRYRRGVERAQQQQGNRTIDGDYRIVDDEERR